MKRIPSIWISCLLLLAACSKNNGKQDEPKNTEPPAVRAHGTPTGEVVKKSIGPAGGSLSSRDNTLQIEVPAGALAANTEISVQAVSNTLPGSPGPAYRLLPEGTRFAKPVKLTFKYTNKHLDSTAEDALFMAYQAQDGIWRFIPKTTLNKTARTLTVETGHFSDWAPYAMFWLRADPNSVLVKKASMLVIYSTNEDIPAEELDDPEIAIFRERVLRKEGNIKNWKLEGAGKLSSSSFEFARYDAPSKVPAVNPVTVSVEVHNFLPGGAIPGRGNIGIVTLLAKIKIEDETYLSGTVNGQEVFCTNVHHKYIPGGWLNFSGEYAPLEGFSCQIEGVSNPVRPGSHSWHSPDYGGTAYLEKGTFTSPVNVYGRTFYSYCEDDEIIDYRASGGELVITNVEQIENKEYITGYMTGTFYKMIRCGTGTVEHFNLQFRTIRNY